MSVLVTGGAGYIGSHMALNRIEAGEDVVVLDNLSTGLDWLIPGSASFYHGDVADAGLVAKVIGDHAVDAIIHFAGSVVVPESVSDPLGYYHNNTVKSHALLDAAVNNDVKHFIFSSTAAVYGTPDQSPVSEDAVLRPESPYGSSKLMTEIMIQDAAKASDLKYGILRYFNVAGADPGGRSGQSSKGSTHLIKVACETVLGKREQMSIFGDDYDTPDGTCVRDYIHVADLVNAHAKLLDHLREGGASLIANCGYGRGHSVKEVIAAVGEVAGKEVSAKMSGRRPGDPAQIVANPRLASETLNWKPEYDDLSLIVRHALDWEERLARRNSNR